MSVLIFSNSEDQSSNHVIDWLLYFGISFDRTTFSKFCKSKTLTFSIHNDGISKISNCNSSYGSIWFRRGEGRYENASNAESVKALLQQKRDDTIVLTFTLKSLTKNSTFWLSSFNSTSINKLDVLIHAKKIGLKIPPSIITNRRYELLSFIEKNGTALCKSTSENFIFTSKLESSYSQPIAIIDTEKIDKISETFFPSFFQKFIKKKYDIRVFYLNGDFYSMAIFNNSPDFRTSYSTNRNVPYSLPSKVSYKLDKLMQLLGLNTGSIDLIKGIDGEYYFLEINPNGQFGMVSQPCNYNLEKKVALLLIEKDKEYGG